MLLRTGDVRFRIPGSFLIVRCSGCGLVRTDPQPDDPSAFYPPDAYYSFSPPPPPSAGDVARVRRSAGLPSRGWRGRVLASRLTEGIPPGPPGDVLDVGCGSGRALLALRAAGWRCHGVEVSEAAVAAARAAGLADVRSGDLLSAGYPPASFDAVRFWHSLEHVRSPREELTEARRLLRPGGVLVVGVPNVASLLARIARDKWFYLDVPRHLWHFDRMTLTRLIDDCGFRVVQAGWRSTSTALLGTIDLVRGGGEWALASRLAWRAALPAAVLLDALRLGDALLVTAVRA